MADAHPSRPGAKAPPRYGAVFMLAGLLLICVAGVSNLHLAAEGAHPIPAPVLDVPDPTGPVTEIAVLAGGCFWGVQGVYQHVKGVSRAVSGYAGGEQKTASYAQVTSGRTGHAEAVQVTFDPHQISYGRILQIFYSVVHDPTQLNRQGPDFGTQYRSALFTRSSEQARIANAYVAQLDEARTFSAPIVTKIESDRAFYPAEDYHQDYLTRNPHHPYIVYNDLPKIDDLKRLFPEIYRHDPVLVMAARTSR